MSQPKADKIFSAYFHQRHVESNKKLKLVSSFCLLIAIAYFLTINICEQVDHFQTWRSLKCLVKLPRFVTEIPLIF